MMEAVRSIYCCFARQLVKVVFILSPGYVLLREPLQFAVFVCDGYLACGRTI